MEFLQNTGHLLFNLCPWLLLEVQSESIAKFPCYIYALGGNLIISRDGNRVFDFAFKFGIFRKRDRSRIVQLEVPVMHDLLVT